MSTVIVMIAGNQLGERASSTNGRAENAGRRFVISEENDNAAADNEDEAGKELGIHPVRAK